MKHGVVEGEPGIFPAPVAKVMRTIGGLFGRHKDKPEPAPSAPPPDDATFSDLDPKPPTGPASGGPSDSARSEEPADPPTPDAN